MRTAKYTLLIICEGKHTEPSFFNSIKHDIKRGIYDISDIQVEIRPEPVVEEINKQIVKISARSPLKAARKQQVLRKAIKEEPEEIKGAPPLKWVLAGRNELIDETFNEVWVVFDHDDHPTRKEAFEKANEEINGHVVNIAFSSRSFEYYMLLNFEKIYYTFSKTECKTTGKNKKSLKCGSKNHPDDCGGSKCINGYALTKGYWDDSKGEESLYPLIKERLSTGFENSVWLREQSDRLEFKKPIYDRNPYINSDKLVMRLTGNFWEWLKPESEIEIANLKLVRKENRYWMINQTLQNVIIPANSFNFIPVNGKRKTFGERFVLKVDETHEITLDVEKPDNDSYFIFNHNGYNVMFS